ncbi:MAG: hypothetical protein ACRC7O_18675 [Fimbriiglobus sp.]
MLPAAESGFTRSEIWDRLPDAVKVNEVRFRSILEAENGKLWVKTGGQGKGGYRYWRIGEPDRTRGGIESEV